MIEHKIIVCPTDVSTKIVYSNLHDYNDLYKLNLATYGDVIIEASTNGAGVLHINDTDFYFAGSAKYNRGHLEWEHDDIYAKLNENGGISITGQYIGSAAIVDELLLGNKISHYNTNTGKKATILTINNNGGSKQYYTLVFSDEVIPKVSDIIIDDISFTANYSTTAENDERYVLRSELDDLPAGGSGNSGYATKQQLMDLSTNINRRADYAINTILDLSSYKYPTSNTKSKANTTRDLITSITEAIDIILENLYYSSPAAISASASIATVNQNAQIIRGEKTDIKITWNVTNYTNSTLTTTISGNGKTKTATGKSGTMTIDTGIYNSAPSYNIRITTDYRDSHNVLPTQYSTTLSTSLKTEEYYTTSTDDLSSQTTDAQVSALENNIKNAKHIISYLTNNNSQKTYQCELTAEGYLYTVLYSPGSPSSITISSVASSGATIINGKTMTLLGQRNITIYDMPVSYYVYKSNTTLPKGKYLITQNYSTGGGTSGGDSGGAYWEDL